MDLAGFSPAASDTHAVAPKKPAGKAKGAKRPIKKSHS
jgi:hypothetical protein